MQQATIVIALVMLFACSAEATGRMLLQNSVIATVTLSRAGKADRCVASLSLKAADGKPITAAATAKVQWTGEATPQQIQASAKAPGRLFTTSSTPKVPTKGCEVQVTELTVGGFPVTLAPGSVISRQISWQ